MPPFDRMTQNTIYNFNAGPAMLPREVMETAQNEFLDYRKTGMSIMEMSHRGSHFQNLLDKAEADLRELLNIPPNYSVVFYPGGASLQFSAVPLNLLEEGDSAVYSLTGVWSVKAHKEASKFQSSLSIAFDGKNDSYLNIPTLNNRDIPENSRYLYITSNNTIYGTRYPTFPDVDVPIVADMTSELLSRKIEVQRFGAIFAGAQKNIGPSGLTILIVRNSLLENRKRSIPALLDWRLMADNKSLYNTPPTYPIYIAGLVFDWLRKKGGLESMEKENESKAKALYSALDSSSFYKVPVPNDFRSSMNVVFHLTDPELESKFTEESESAGLMGLPGHRSAGGFRASIYNAMPRSGVESLIEFLKYFEKKFG